MREHRHVRLRPVRAILINEDRERHSDLVEDHHSGDVVGLVVGATIAWVCHSRFVANDHSHRLEVHLHVKLGAVDAQQPELDRDRLGACRCGCGHG